MSQDSIMREVNSYVRYYLGIDQESTMYWQSSENANYEMEIVARVSFDHREVFGKPHVTIQKALDNIFKLEEGQWYKNIKRQHEKEIERLKSEHELQLETLRTELENKNDILTCKNDELMEEIREVSCKRLSLTEYVEQNDE